MGLCVSDSLIPVQVGLAHTVGVGVKWAADFGRMLQMTATDESFPTIGKMMRGGDFAGAEMSLDEMIDFGLERILDGIAVYCERRGANRASPN